MYQTNKTHLVGERTEVLQKLWYVADLDENIQISICTYEKKRGCYHSWISLFKGVHICMLNAHI